VTTVDAYLAGLRPAYRAALRAVRRTIRRIAPDATESISYGIPTYKVEGKRLVYVGAATNHLAVHMIRREHLAEAKRLGFGVGRGSIRFTPERPLPERLLTRIVKARLAEIRAKR